MKINSTEDKGAILVFFAIALVVLLGFVALVIDTGIGESGRGEEDAAVQNAALAGMSAYLEALRTPSADAKAVAASRAQSILAASHRISQNYRATPQASTTLSSTNNSGDGNITFGKIVWTLPTPSADGDSEETVACSSKVPCFRPNTSSSQPATAIEIRTTSHANPLKTIFGRVFGVDRYEVGNTSIATLLPQNYLFLVDLSMSIVDQTYKRYGSIDPDCAHDQTGLPKDFCNNNNWYLYPACALAASSGYFSYDVNKARYDAVRTSSADCAQGLGTCACFSSPDNSVNCLQFPWNPLQPSFAENEVNGLTSSVDSEHRRARRIFGGYSDLWRTSDANSYNAGFPISCRPSVDLDKKAQCLASDPTAPDYCRIPPPAPYPMPMPSRDQYRVVESELGNDLALGDNNSAPYVSLVDFGAGGSATSFKAKPEPLRSILDATNDAMNFISKRAVAADRFMLTGFDQSVFAARTTCKTGSTDTCDAGDTLVAPGSPSFEGFLNLTNVKTTGQNWGIYSPSNMYHFLNRTFFPRPGLNTDIQLALWKAYDELAANPSASVAKNLVFLITDGLANCRYLDPSSPPDDQHFSNLSEYLGNQRCAGSPESIGETVIESINQLNSLIRAPLNKTLVELLKLRNISVSVILIGKNVAPHYLVKPSAAPGTNSGCLTSGQATYGNYSFVNWNSTLNDSGQLDLYTCDKFGPNCSNGYNQTLLRRDATNALILDKGTLPLSNRLYSELVAPTKGAWIPIMEQLKTPGGSAVNFSSQLAAKCNAVTPTYDANNNLKLNPMTELTVDIPGLGTRQVTDKFGRLLYDPYGRTQQEQITEQVKQVLGGGFVLVEPAVRAQN